MELVEEMWVIIRTKPNGEQELCKRKIYPTRKTALKALANLNSNKEYYETGRGKDRAWIPEKKYFTGSTFTLRRAMVAINAEDEITV